MTVKGKGTFVSKPKIVEDTTVFLESFSKEMATKGISVQTEVLEQRMIVADEEVASKLKVPCGDEVIKIVRLRYFSHDSNGVVRRNKNGKLISLIFRRSFHFC